MNNHDQQVKSIIQAIAKIPSPGGGSNSREAFATFIQHALCILNECNTGLGQPLFSTQANYRGLGFTPVDPAVPLSAYKEIETAAHTYYEAVRDLPPFIDLIGPVFAHFIGRSGEGMGQFFTPWPMAQSACNFLENQPGAYLRVLDPCCGAGGLLLAYLDQRAAQSESVVPVSILANDLDPLCAAMTALQLIAGQIVHGKTLGSVQVQVGDFLTGKGQVVFQSVARGGAPQDAASGFDLILTNPPFGASAGLACERAGLLAA